MLLKHQNNTAKSAPGLGHSKYARTNNNICVRCGKDCPTNKCNSNYKKCINCDGPHSSNQTNCDKLRQHIYKRYQQNTTLTYAQVLNKQEHKLDIIQQQQNTQLTEIQTTLTTLQQLELQNTQRLQQSQIEILNNIRPRTEERIERVKNNITTHNYINKHTAQYLTDITNKLNEHIKHIEDFTYRVSPEILTQIHIHKTPKTQ